MDRTRALVDSTNALLEQGEARLDRQRFYVAQARRELLGLRPADRRLEFLTPARRCEILLELDRWAGRIEDFGARTSRPGYLRRFVIAALGAVFDLEQVESEEVLEFYLERPTHGAQGAGAPGR